MRSGEDVISLAFLVRNVEALRLHIEHGPVPASESDQFIVSSKLDDTTMLEHANPVGMPNC